MNIRKSIYAWCAAGALLLASCSDFTDIQPKGKNLLSTTADLEMLLDAEHDLYFSTDLYTMCGDAMYAYSSVANAIALPSKTRSVIMWTWDESSLDKMAELTSSDYLYEGAYEMIGKVANAVLSLVDDAEGDEATRNKQKAEAYPLRAFYHFWVVNKFAAAYNPATAATTPGVPYATDDWDISTNIEKSTIQEVYDNILADAQAAIDLDGLPVSAVNSMRMNKACPYAIKALALRNMQRYAEAEAAAKEALAISGTVTDYNTLMSTTQGYLLGLNWDVIIYPADGTAQDLFFTPDFTYFRSIYPETWDQMEDGNILKEYISTDWIIYDNLMGYGTYTTGLDYKMVYDLDSRWNSYGLSTAELYLTIAEAEIEQGNISAAVEALETIRQNRFITGTYQPLEGIDTKAEAIAALKKVEVPENYLNCWGFVNKKRWTQLDDWKETYQHTLADETYYLAPDSKMWIFPFPKNAVDLNPYLTQNYE